MDRTLCLVNVGVARFHGGDVGKDLMVTEVAVHGVEDFHCVGWLVGGGGEVARLIGILCTLQRSPETPTIMGQDFFCSHKSWASIDEFTTRSLLTRKSPLSTGNSICHHRGNYLRGISNVTS